MKELNEPILSDDYPMHCDYWYVVDGKPTCSDWYNITVAEYKRLTGAKEIRRCDIFGRQKRDP